MSRAPSFADWQFSRGIVPWVVVHDFAEYDHKVYELKARCGFALRRTAEPMLEAFREMARTVAAMSDNFEAFALAIASAGAAETQP